MNDPEAPKLDPATEETKPKLPDPKLDKALDVTIYEPISAPAELKDRVMDQYRKETTPKK